MLHWEKGKIDDYGIWYKHWYGNIINSTGFKKNNNEEIFIDKKFDKIYKNCLEIYNLIDSYSIKL